MWCDEYGLNAYMGVLRLFCVCVLAFRCLSQIHGIAHDTIKFVYGIIQTEMNSATGESDHPAPHIGMCNPTNAKRCSPPSHLDNPMIFADEPVDFVERCHVDPYQPHVSATVHNVQHVHLGAARKLSRHVSNTISDHKYAYDA